MEHNRIVYEKLYDSEVEYLESTGTQWVNTEYKPNTNTRTVGRCYFNSFIGSKANYVFGVFTRPNNYGFNVGVARQFFNVPWGSNDGINLTGLIPQTNEDYEFDISKTGYKVNGTSYATPSTELVNSTRNMYLFWSNGTSAVGMNGRIYYCKIYNGNTLVRDFIPVRKGSIGYFYDKVSKKLFGNKGIGNFILGPDVANPVPNIRRVFRFGNKRFVMPIPSVHYDSKIEYLQSTGTQWIDTDCIPNKNTGFYFDGVILSSTLNRPYNSLVFGVGTTSWRKAYVCYAKLQNDRGLHQPKDFVVGNRMSYDAKLSYDTRLQFSLIDEKLIATDRTTISVDFNSFTPLNYSMLIFGINFEGSPNYFSNLKIYNFKIYDNNTLIRDFIPVRRGNTGYLYDKVSKKLFKNKGTGNFILGNDIN